MSRGKSLAMLAVFGLVIPMSAVLGAAEEPDRQALEKKFEEQLSGAVLVGNFTIVGQEVGNGSREERYHIKKVSKLPNGFWLFQAGVQYGGKKEVTVPIPLAVKWAGDTPVITLTKLNIPLLGTYTARVLIYDGQYVGVWSGGDHGGQMYGRIERADADSKEGASNEKEE